MDKQYLGDSVYAQFDGYGVILTTENGMPSDPSNEIYMEPEVILALVNQYVNNWNEGAKSDFIKRLGVE